MRIYLSLFYRYRLAPGNEYTVGVVLSAMTTLPCICGPTGVLMALFYVVCAELTVAFNGVAIHDPEFQQLMHEIDRNRIFNSSSHSSADIRVKDADVAEARVFFDKVDEDKSGTLDLAEIKTLLQDSRVDASVLQEIVRASASGKLSFDQFYRRVWSLRNNSTTVKAKCKDAKTEADQARLVFNALDGDGASSGT